MSGSFQQFGRRVIAGQARGPAALLLRAVTRLVEPFYTLAVRLRNRRFDRGRGVRRLPRPVISVGNLTAGGTGKTPVVHWLCDHLRRRGHRAAVLLRGYRAKPGQRGDEQTMLDHLLNRPITSGMLTSVRQGNSLAAPIPVHANPDRHLGGTEVLDKHPDTTCFVLDDGFQHRRLARDFDLVLIDATNPFGYGHVIPRGLLREPPAGLARADAILITRADQGDAAAAERLIRRYNPAAPVYRCAHAHAGVRRADDSLAPLDDLAGKRLFVVTAIGNPEGFIAQLPADTIAGVTNFPDHWDYTRADVERHILAHARESNADLVVTTEKDWVKLRRLVRADDGPPIVRIDLAVQFENPQAEQALLTMIENRATPSSQPTPDPRKPPNHSGRWVVIALFLMALGMGITAVLFRGPRIQRPSTTAPTTRTP